MTLTFYVKGHEKEKKIEPYGLIIELNKSLVLHISGLGEMLILKILV